MRHEGNIIQVKDHDVNHINLIKFLHILAIIKNTYLKVDIVCYHIFINLLVNHIYKNNFVECRKFILIFALIRTAISITFFSML